ncbi:UDP-glucose 4-epimerase [Paenibacillus sp. UNCCL117]|uniref:NAD-dependent epimerase/dehydratase family protein n=1 Tax=unclassified Paenibacillus TaxID=185978 RepID=UPI0008853B12|nr:MULTISPECIES: NAD-dependent epimerase/dehydratase family protein [unclassified Paenibacillus]SDD30635.1 UDP-glucose 4-epimerase [Paenibacillus sp. cl123]SFW40307.1 UDP-glucose 4-epimerase [Paenibacillus sp. UNCCL117]
MKLIVTGGAGFIGSHLVDALTARGAEVHVIDNLYAGKLEYVNRQAVLHQYDVESAEAREQVVRLKPDLVFHLAAQADVQQSVQAPGYDARVNVLGTLNMLEACREAGVRKLVFASTSGVYGDLAKDRIEEDDPAAPISFYALSKLAGEQYIRLFHRMFGLSYTILRYGNVYGPRQQAKGEGGVVALFTDKLRQGLPVRIFGDGEQTRDFIFVKDIVEANLACIGQGDQQTFHASTGRPVTVNTLVRELERLSGTPLAADYLPPRQGDIRHSCLDNRKLTSMLGWQPAYDIVSGLRETYEYVQQRSTR